MNQHINNILSLKDELFAMGEEIAKSHITAFLLSSLPRSYDSLVIVLEARSEQEFTLEFTKNKLVDECRHK